MTNKQKNKLLCVDDLRHAEYYQMQDVFDELYEKSKSGEIFTPVTAEVKRAVQIMW